MAEALATDFTELRITEGVLIDTLNTAIAGGQAAFGEIVSSDIDPSQFFVLSRYDYQKVVVDLAMADSHQIWIDNRHPQALKYSGAVVMPNFPGVIMSDRYIEVHSDPESLHPYAKLAGGSAHEYFHRFTLDFREKVDVADLRVLYGEEDVREILERYGGLPDLEFVQVGPATEIRSKGKIATILNLRTVEFLADIVRYHVILNYPSSPYTVKSLCGYILYPGGLLGLRYNELAINNDLETKFSHLFSLLVSQVLPIDELRKMVVRGYKAPIRCVTKPPSRGIDSEVYIKMIELLRGDGREEDLAYVFKSIISQKYEDLDMREACEYLKRELFGTY